jgi:capsular polysaccharide transport system permease protein
MDALVGLNQTVDLKAAFGSKKIDFIKRFGGLMPGKSLEDLLRYYQWFVVSPDIDSTSQIATLTVRAYTAEDAFRINEKLLALSEGLVNRMNEQARQDMIGFALREVALAEDRAKDARIALSAYRNEKTVLDPEREGGVQLEEVIRLQSELVSSKAELAQLQSFAPDNPQVPFLKSQIATVESELAALTKGVSGAQGSLSNKAADYDKVAVEREFADKQLEAAQTFLEQARDEAMRKQLYLERVVQPSIPTIAWEPRRLKDVMASFMLSLVVWLVLTLIISGVREHSD